MRTIPAKLFGLVETAILHIQTFLNRHLGVNGDLKVLALAVAIVIFNLIRMTIGHPETYTAPVDASIEEEGVAILRHTPTEVEVELKGATEDIRNFDPSNLKVEVKIRSGSEDRDQTIRLSRRNIVGAGKLRVGRITPQEILVEYDREVEMVLLLTKPVLLGKPLQGNASVELIVNEVKVRGPESQLQKLIEKNILLPTDPVDVSGRTQGFIKRVKILPPDDSGISHVFPAEVEARVYIAIDPPQESIYTNAPMPTASARTYTTRIASTNHPSSTESNNESASDTHPSFFDSEDAEEDLY